MEPQSTATRRLLRRSDDRYLAGVAGGVADYFSIDPVIVRIAFVVLTFVGGAGAIAYAAGWLLIPEEGEETSVAEEALRTHNWVRIAGFVLIAIAASVLLRPLWWFGGGMVTAIALILLGVYLLAHRGGDAPTRTPTDPGAPPPAPPAAGTVPTPPTPPPPPTATWPSPPPPPPPPPPVLSRTRERSDRRAEVRDRRERRREQRRERSGVTAMTIGILLVGAGVIGLIFATNDGIEPTHVFGGALVLVGAALVLTSWFGRGGALIPIGVLLFALLSLSSLIDVPFKGGVGNRTEQPTSTAELKPEYHLAVGQLTIDLSSVPFAPESTTYVKATVGVGHLVVIVPRGVEVDLRGHAGAGAVQLPGNDDTQGGVRVNRDAQLAAGAGPGAPRINLDAEVGVGQVEVRDAAS